MNFDLSEEQKMIRDMARDFAESEVKPVAAEIDRTDAFPWKIYKRMAELGLLAMTLPPEYGGSGADTVSWSIVEEELARASAAVADAQLLLKLMSHMILCHGTEEQKKKYIREMGKGERICATGMTEPDAGSDLRGIKTTARREGDDYILNGTKRFMTCGNIVDMVIALVYTDRSKGSKGMTSIIVEMGTPGFSRGKKEELMGVRGLETSELIFEDCRVSKDNLLGQEGQGWQVALGSLDMGRIGIGSQALGVAQAAMEEAVKYAKQRVAFGQPIAKFQAIQFMIADMSSHIEAARLLLRKAAFLSDQGKPFTREAAEAKLFASDLAVKAATDALQIHGAYGYTREYPIERIYRDAKVYQIWEGTNQIQRTVIARHLLK
ncbi:MAG: acyl-CoA dehydrogenase family protein [Thermodesulfobacteriota bacterium]|nr:acyl-CoA dehydrogenase family protein [Thermodesulfobacteriota bacterium]